VAVLLSVFPGFGSILCRTVCVTWAFANSLSANDFRMFFPQKSPNG